MQRHRHRSDGRAMTAGDLAVILAAVLCAIGFAALIVVLVRVLDTLKALRGEVESLRSETGPLLRRSAREHRRGTRGDGRRPATISSASTACSARRRRSASAVEGSSRLARRALLGADDQGRRHRHRHEPHRAAAAAQRTPRPSSSRSRPTPEACMMKRVTWFVGGVVAGAAGAGYAKKKVRSDGRPTGAGQRRQVGRRSSARSGPPRRRRDPRRTLGDAHPRGRARRRAATPGSRRSTTGSSPATSSTSTGGRSTRRG